MLTDAIMTQLIPIPAAFPQVNAAQKKEILAQETPVEIEGQRPRTLPPCHLAAFLGFTDLVVLYLDNGAEVNAVNSKMDTALLWAAR